MTIDRPAIRAALETLRAHEPLLLAAMIAEDTASPFDRQARVKEAHDRVMSALYEIVEGDFRSAETPRGS